MRPKIEENDEQGTDLLGMGAYQVRNPAPWHRHVTCALLAQAFLAVTRTQHLGEDHQSQEVPACRHPHR